MSKLPGLLRTVLTKFREAPGHTFGWYSIGGLFDMYLDGSNEYDKSFYTGSYDPLLVRIVKNCVKAGDTCVDIGAQKGYVTLHLASLVGEKGRVVSFEPDHRSREILSGNISRNNFSNVEVMEYAVGDKNDEVQFYLSSQLGWSSCYPNELAKKTITSVKSIKVRRIDSLLAEKELAVDAGRLGFVKIDCEGAELLAVTGMERLLREADPLLWIEINAASLKESKSSADDLYRKLSGLGYGIFLPEGEGDLASGGKVIFRRLEQIVTEGNPVFDIAAFKITPVNLARFAASNIEIRLS